MATLRAELADLRQHFAQRVEARVALLLRARQVAPNATFDAGASDEAIRARAVSDAMGPAAIDGKSSAYIEARFDHLADQRPADPVVLALRTGQRPH
ncbi:MAG: hypothetical protein J0H15_04970 [Xanthomonadales bacterium]|nr:hypothetical protein [Xanthomonadales bacterium]